MDYQATRQTKLLELQDVDETARVHRGELERLDKRGTFLRGAIAMLNELLDEQAKAEAAAKKEEADAKAKAEPAASADAASVPAAGALRKLSRAERRRLDKLAETVPASTNGAEKPAPPAAAVA